MFLSSWHSGEEIKESNSLSLTFTSVHLFPVTLTLCPFSLLLFLFCSSSHTDNPFFPLPKNLNNYKEPFAMDAPNYGHDNGAPSSYNQPPTYTHQEEHAPLIPKANTDGKFTPDASYKDVWATVLFIGNLFGYFGLTYYSAKHFISNPFTVLEDGTSVASNAFLADHAFVVLALTSLAFTFSLSYGYFVLIQRYTAALVKISWFFSVFFTIAIGVLQILSGSLWGALSIAVGVLCLFLYKYWASRMAFSVLVLETVTSVTRKYPATLAVSALPSYLFIIPAGFFPRG